MHGVETPSPTRSKRSLSARELVTGVIAVAALMVSRLPTPAFRPVRVRPDQARLLLLAAVAVGAALLTYPWLTLVLLDVGYLLLLVLGWKQRRRHHARKDG